MMTSQALTAQQTTGSPRTRARRDLETITSGGGAMLLASAFGNGLSYALTILLARTLGPEDFGIYALGLTIFNTIVLLVMCGLDTAVVKFISERVSLGQTREAHRLIRQTAVIAGCIGVATGLGLVGGARPLAMLLYDKPMLVPVLWGFALAIPFAVLNAVLVSALLAFQSFRPAIVVKYLWEPTGKIVLAGLMLWAGFQVGGIVAAIAVTLVISTALAVKALRLVTGAGWFDALEWHRDETRSLLAYCSPLIIANLFGVIAPRSDMMVLGYWVSPQEVGVYLAAFQTASILALVLGAFDMALAPIIGRALAQHDRARLELGYQSVLRLSMTLSVPVFLLLVLFADDLLRVFGAEFAAGAMTLIILALGQVFNSTTGSANTVLLMSGASGTVMTNTVVFGVLQIVATVLLIPLWGLAGAAIAAAASLVFINIARVVEVWQLHRVLPWSWGLSRPLLAGAIVAGLVLLTKGRTTPEYYPLLCVFGGGAYFVCLTFMGWDQADKEMVHAITVRLGIAPNKW